MVHRPNVGIPHVSPHVVPKASLGGAAAVTPIAPADEEKTAVDSSWEDEQSTIDQAEMADKVRRALAEKRRAGSAGSTTGTTGGHSVDEPTVEDRARPGIEAAAALGVARLLVESGPDAGKDFPLRAGKPVLVGRALDNSIVLTDLSVSRKHFEINWDGGHWALSDRGSGNGTLLNGKLEEGTFRLFAGDRIEIGHTTFRFEQTGQGQRNQWSEEEPSTIAGRRNSAVGSPRPSALQTSEFDVSPAESAAISMVERKPIPLADPRNLPIDLHRRPTAAPSPNPYTAPGSASVAALSPVPSAAPGSPGLPPPSSPQFLGNNPRHAVRPLLGDIPGGTPFNNGSPGGGVAPGAPFNNGGLSAPGAPGLRSTALGNPPPGSSPMLGSSASPVSGQNGPPSAPLGTPMMGGGLAPPRSSPMNTLTGRPPVVGPTAPPSMGDAMVPPRQISQSSIPLDMIPGMTTVPHPRSLVAPPMSRPTLSAQHERAIAPRMMSRSNDMIADSGVAISPPRFPNGQPSEPRSLLADGVPRLNRPNKTTIALIGGGVVLLVAVVALAMSTGNDAPVQAPNSTSSTNATNPTGTSTANGTSVEPIDQPVKSAELLAAEKAAAEKAAAEKAAAEKAAAEKLAAEQAAAEKIAAEKLTAERLAAEKLAAEKTAAEKTAAEKLAIEQAAAEKAAAEKAERLAAEKAAAEKAAALKADKAAAAREARLAAEKAAAEKAAAQKAAKNKKDQPKRVEKDKERVVETAAPQSEVDSEAVLSKAEDLYRKKNFAAAASTIREAIRGRTSGTDELRATAQIYEALQRTYNAGTAVGAKPTEAYTNLRSASRYDEKLGSAHSSDINPRILALAPRAAAQFLALKQYEEAFQALRDAERAGASNSTLNAVRTAVDARANELYNEAQSKRADDPAAARSLYKKVLKLVESGSPLYQKATKGVAETT